MPFLVGSFQVAGIGPVVHTTIEQVLPFLVIEFQATDHRLVAGTAVADTYQAVPFLAVVLDNRTAEVELVFEPVALVAA